MKHSPSTLPPIREIARDLRGGTDLDALCSRYGVAPSALADRLAYAGYATTGEPVHTEGPREPLTSRVDGNCTTGSIGGGDQRGLPVDPVLHRDRRKVFIGLDWTVSPAEGPRWVWVR